MTTATASYAEVTLPGYPWTVAVPVSRADDADWLEGTGALLYAAIGYYSASVEALRAGDVPGAIGHAERAVTLMPYAPRLLEYVAVLSIRHGDFELADRVLRTAADLGLDNLAVPYRAELERRVVAWNEALADPALRSPDAAEDPDELGYRELLLAQSREGAAVDSISNGRDQERGRQAASSNVLRRAGWREWAVLASTAGLAMTIGIFVGPELIPKPPTASTTPAGVSLDAGTSVTPGGSGGTDNATANEEPQPSTVALLALASGDASGAADVIVEARGAGAAGSELDAVEELIGERLIASSEAAWRARRFDEVLTVLRPLDAMREVGHPDGLYYLGVAAEASGENGLALRAFSRFVAAETSRSQPHRRAQAAYSAARLASGAEAVRFAQIVTGEFPGSVYDNSAIRRLVSNGTE